MAKSTSTPANITNQLDEPGLAEDTEIAAEDETELDESREEKIRYAESDVPQFIESLYSKDEAEYQKVR